ncbi:antibiotic resistance protein VanZ [Mesorhizobium sp. L103C119B0]|nr:antibiotic resistance protein VanZ [Mesorhizobium sp. L103C119B0]
MFVTVCRTAAWLTFIAIVVVTIDPIGLRPISGFGPEPERIAAFLAFGLLLGLAYHRNWLLTLCLVVAAAFGIEALQLLSPTRHPAVDDAVVKAAAGVAGVLAAYLIARNSRSRQRP